MNNLICPICDSILVKDYPTSIASYCSKNVVDIIVDSPHFYISNIGNTSRMIYQYDEYCLSFDYINDDLIHFSVTNISTDELKSESFPTTTIKEFDPKNPKTIINKIKKYYVFL